MSIFKYKFNTFFAVFIIKYIPYIWGHLYFSKFALTSNLTTDNILISYVITLVILIIYAGIFLYLYANVNDITD